MPDSKRDTWLILVISLIAVSFGVAFVVRHLRASSDGARIVPGGITARGVQIEPLISLPNGLHEGDYVFAVNRVPVEAWAESLFGRRLPLPARNLGETVHYLVIRDRSPVQISVPLGPYPLREIFSRTWGTIVFALVFQIVATFVFFRRPEHPAGRVLFLAASCVTSSTAWSFGLSIRDLMDGTGFWLYKICTLLFYNLYWTASLHFALLFPRPLPIVKRRGWIPAMYGVPFILLAVYLFAIRPLSSGTLDWFSRWSVAEGVHSAGFLTLTVLAIIWQIRRNVVGSSRQQIRWVTLAGLISGGGGLLLYILPGALGLPQISPNYLGLIIIPFPVALAIALLRHNLFDIDHLINRTLVYGTLTVIVAGLYVLLVGSAGLVLQTRSNLAGLLLTGLLTIAIFRPVHGFVQRGVDHIIYRERPHSSQRPLAELEEAISIRLSGRWLKAARVGWFVLAVVVIGVLLASLPGYATKFRGQLAHVTGSEMPPGAHFFAAASGVASLASSLLSIGLAALLFRRKFSEPIAALLSYFLLIYGVVMAGPLEHVSKILPDILPFAQAIQGVLLATPMIALLMLFPSGRFIPSWTRWVVILSIPWNFALLLIAPFDAEGFSRNPPLSAAVAILFIAFSFTGIYAQIYRYRRASTPTERGQTRWVIYGFALWFVYMFISTIPYVYLTGLPPDAPTPWWGPASELGWWLSLNILPVCLTIAVTRHQLWDIDFVVNRTLVYGALTVSVIAVYILIVGGMGFLFRAGDNFILPLFATGLAAVLFHPLRLRLQRGINRMMYGDRDDPAAVLNKLSIQLEQTGSPESALDRIVETIAQTLKLPYTAIELGDSHVPIASFGIPTYLPKIFPLIYQGEPVGRMAVAGRDPDGELTPKDIQLLENIAHQAGVVAHNVRLTGDLQRSRQNLVTAREEERRRIRRDLHDGLGPQLASQTLTLDAIEKLLDRDPEQAKALIKDLKSQSKEAITDIRRLIYDLRPPALDDLGLVEALRQDWEQTSAGDITPDGVRITLAVPTPLPPFPAAVELAAYRIVQEAVNNVIKHAQANTCTIRLEMQNNTLRVEISDDGSGLPVEVRSGVGLHSMRERAEELGGRLDLARLADGGTRVCAWLPVSGGN